LSVPGIYCGLLAALMLVLFFWWDGLWNMGMAAASALVGIG
jgi:hypothetical protein